MILSTTGQKVPSLSPLDLGVTIAVAAGDDDDDDGAMLISSLFTWRW